MTKASRTKYSVHIVCANKRAREKSVDHRCMDPCCVYPSTNPATCMLDTNNTLWSVVDNFMGMDKRDSVVQICFVC